VVDAANVMGARPDGWWRDRVGAALRLYRELARLAAGGRPVLGEEAGPPAFVMVLEGTARAAASRLPAADAGRPGEVAVVQAHGSGDDAIVALLRELPGRRIVVTADRQLRDRSLAAGATVRGPGWLLGLLRGD